MSYPFLYFIKKDAADDEYADVEGCVFFFKPKEE